MEIPMTLTNLERLTIQRADLQYELELLEDDVMPTETDMTAEAIRTVTASIAQLDAIISQAMAS